MAVLNPKRLTVEEFHQMADAGSFLPDERVELIRGEIVDMPPMGSRHIACVIRLNRLLTGCLGPRVLVSPQCPLPTSRRAIRSLSPDVALL